MLNPPPWTYARLREVVFDAAFSPRLTAWESEFIASIRSGLNRYGVDFQPTEKQMAALLKIERKVYDTG